MADCMGRGIIIGVLEGWAAWGVTILFEGSTITGSMGVTILLEGQQWQAAWG